MNDNFKFEYDKTELNGMAAKYMRIPMSIVLNKELDLKSVAILSYFRMRCGLNNIVGFTIPDLVKWCGRKVDRRIGGNNDRFLDIVNELSDWGYLTFLTKQSRSSYMECEFNLDYYEQECEDNYAVLYLDEIDKIMSYKDNKEKSSSPINTTILLTFAYFRNKIIRRPNELKPEERSPDKIKERRERLPEAYDGFINEIAGELGISTVTLTKIVDILEHDLQLIVTDRPYRAVFKNVDGQKEYRTPQMIFANSYKRDSNFLLKTDDNYSRQEIELKANKIKEYYKTYEINKDKRNQRKRGKVVSAYV